MKKLYNVKYIMLLIVSISLILGITKWGIKMSKLSKKYLVIARSYESKSYEEQDMEDFIKIKQYDTDKTYIDYILRKNESVPMRIERSKELYKCYNKLREKYMRLACYPFLPLTPDPTEP